MTQTSLFRPFNLSRRRFDQSICDHTASESSAARNAGFRRFGANSVGAGNIRSSDIRPRRIRTGSVLAVALLLLAGCSTAGTSGTAPADATEAAPSSTSKATSETSSEGITTETTTEKTEGSTTGDPAPACDSFFNTEMHETEDLLAHRIPDLLTDYPAELNRTTAEPYLAMNDELQDLAAQSPQELKAPLATIRAPFEHTAAIVAGEREDSPIDTGKVSSAIAGLVTACVAAGYTVED